MTIKRYMKNHHLKCFLQEMKAEHYQNITKEVNKKFHTNYTPMSVNFKEEHLQFVLGD
jgi:hypothetical protein